MKTYKPTGNVFINYDNVRWILPLPRFYKVRVHSERTGEQIVSFLWKLNLITGEVSIEMMRGEYTKRIRAAIADFTRAHGGKKISYARLKCLTGEFVNRRVSR